MEDLEDFMEDLRFRCQDENGRDVLPDALFLRWFYMDDVLFFFKNNRLNYIEIKDKSIAVSIKGKIVHIGDPWQTLVNVKLFTRHNDGDNGFTFLEKDKERNEFFLYFKVSRTTDRIEGIYYYANY